MSYNNPPPGGDYSGGYQQQPGDHSGGGGYPPPGGDYNSGGYPPPGGGYPDQGGYQDPNAYPPQQGAYGQPDPGYPASGPGYGPPPPPPPKKGMSTGLLVGLIAGGALLLCLCVGGAAVIFIPGLIGAGGTKVTYGAASVGGNGLSSVTYTEGSTSSNYDSVSGNSWSKAVTTTKSYVSLTVRASYSSSEYSTVACTIYSDGKTVDTQSATSTTSVTCSGSV